MAPRAANTWRRPYTSIYNDNYRYGSSLYSGTLSDIEKKYTDSLSRTQLRSDRGDLALSTFVGSALTSSPTPGASSVSPSVPLTPVPTLKDPYAAFESRLSSVLRSPYIADDHQFEPLLSSTEKRARSLETMRPQMHDDKPFSPSLPRVLEKPEQEKAAEENKPKKKTNEPAPRSISPGGGSPAHWKEKCRDLQMQLDELTQGMSDTGSKVRDELANMKGKFHTEINDLVATVDQTSRQCNELQKTVKKQANQLLEFQSAYDDIQRHLQDSQEEVSTWQKRCQYLRKEMDRLRSDIDEAARKSAF